MIEDASTKAEITNPAIFSFSKDIEKITKEYTLQIPFLINPSLAVYNLEAKNFKETRSLLYDYRN